MTNVPNIDNDTKAFLENAYGFRAQEVQGRWMLGRISSIEVSSPIDQKVGLYTDFVLPQAEQMFEIVVNGRKIANFNKQSIPFSYSGQSILSLKKGVNEIIFKTDKSNNMVEQKPFAPLDKTDISVSFSRISIRKLSLYEDQISSPIYNAYSSTEVQNTYYPVMSNTAELFLYKRGTQILNINLLKAFSNQNFVVSVDNKVIGRINSPQNQSLLRRQFIIQFPDGAHLLSIRAITKEGKHGIVEETSEKVAKMSGKGIFYIQSISSSSNFLSIPFFSLLFSVILSIILLYMVNLFFLKK